MLGDVDRFDRFARVYDLLMPRAKRRKLERGLEHARRPGETVVDVAGGTGRGVRALDVATSVVVDAARGMVELAAGEGLAAVQGDAGELPLSTESVDAVLVVDALHHLPDPQAAIGEAARSLAPGGVLVVADFDPTTIRGRVLAHGEHLVGFESRFETPDAVAVRLERAGLEPIHVERGFGYVVAGVAPDRGMKEGGDESR